MDVDYLWELLGPSITRIIINYVFDLNIILIYQYLHNTSRDLFFLNVVTGLHLVKN